MTNTDFILIQAPMITELRLKGNALLLFALIYGFSKDSHSRFRGSLAYMAEWLQTSKSAVIRTLNELEQGGYIERYPVMVGKVQQNEYRARYTELIEAMSKLKIEDEARQSAEQNQSLFTLSLKGSQNDNDRSHFDNGGSQNDNDRSHFDNDTGLKMRPNNIIDNIIYNIFFYCGPSATKEEEKNFLFEFYFFKNARNPGEEVERFFAYNEANGWSNSTGRRYDTVEKRLGLGKLWEFQLGADRTSDYFLSFWRDICSLAKKANLADAAVLLDSTARIEQNAEKVILHLKQSTAHYLNNHSGVFKPAFHTLLQGRKLEYRFTQKNIKNVKLQHQGRPEQDSRSEGHGHQGNKGDSPVHCYSH